MSRLFRWQYSVPRILAVVVALLAVQFVLGLIARARVERSLSAFFSSDASLSAARVSYVDGRVTFHGLSVADTERTAVHLFEAECCDLDFDLDVLLRRGKLTGVGHASGLRFFPMRPPATLTTDDIIPLQVKPTFGRGDTQTVLASMHASRERLTRDWTEQLPSLSLTQQVTSAWSHKRDALTGQLNELERKSTQLELLAEAANRNPLRNQPFFETLPSDLEFLQTQAAELTREINHAPEGLDKGRRIIVAARAQDEQFLRENLASPAIDPQQLASYLYAKQVNQLLPELTHWLKWSRETFPITAKTSGHQAPPNVLLRTLTLAGDVHLSGQSFHVAGELTDFTPQPHHLDGPIRLRLKSTDSSDLDIQLTIDRSGDTPREELLVTCRTIAPPAAMLGTSDGLQLQLTPNSAAWTISLRLEADRLEGEFQVVQTGVEVAAKFDADDANSALAKALDETLPGMDSVATRLSLGGSLDKPSCTLWSNLGAAASSAWRIAAERSAEQRGQEGLAVAQKRVDERLAQLDREIADEQSQLLARTTGRNEAWQRLAAESHAPSRLQIERLGRLPAHSLFR